jgi:menaquinone-dependent protoporphyrinogen oxidase
MKPVAVFYATSEGHTHRIAEHIGADLRTAGLVAEVLDVAVLAGTIDVTRYAGAILIAPVHGTHPPRDMIRFVELHRAGLERMPTAFLSVSLAEAGAEDPLRTAHERAEAAQQIGSVVDRFYEHTGWHPTHSFPVAGALLYTQHGRVVRLIMKTIARRAHAATDTTRDHVYTDWEALDRFVEGIAGELRAAAT